MKNVPASRTAEAPAATTRPGVGLFTQRSAYDLFPSLTVAIVVRADSAISVNPHVTLPATGTLFRTSTFLDEKPSRGCAVGIIDGHRAEEEPYQIPLVSR